MIKTASTLVVFGLLAGSAFADFENWTNKDGKTAELELVKVTDAGSEKSGEFVMRNGKTVTLNSSDLSTADAERLAKWTPNEEEEAAVDTTSVYDKILDGNLLKLDGRSLKRAKEIAKPEKYYAFYYTASWCGPCHAFTPELVKFYKKHKNSNFELVVITSDSDEDAMEEYAKEMKMPWPQLKMSKVKDFDKEFNYGVTGIPSLIVCKLDGTKLGNYRSDLKGLAKLID